MLNKILKKKEGKEEKKKSESEAEKSAEQSGELIAAKGFAPPRRSIIKKPYLSERAYAGQERGKYEFLVADSATKPSIREEIKLKYGVHATSVNIIRVKAKPKHWRGKKGRQRSRKKAVVTLKPGERIEIT